MEVDVKPMLSFDINLNFITNKNVYFYPTVEVNINPIWI